MRIPKNIKKGDWVRYRLFNVPEQKFYGPVETVRVAEGKRFCHRRGVVITIYKPDYGTMDITEREYRGRVK